MRKNLVIFLILICINFLFISCETKPSRVPRVIIALFDLSESTAAQDMRSAYFKGFSKIVDSLEQGDILYGACITEKSIQQLELPIQFEYPVFKPTTDNIQIKPVEEEEFNKKVSLEKEKLLQEAEKILFGSEGRPKILKTDIMSSFILAANVLNRYPGRKKLIVVFSDMIEDSERYNFERINLTDQKIKEILDREEKLGNIPELTGVKIYVVGAQAKSLEKYNSIKKFWTEYFKVTGAELADYSSSFLGLKE